MTCYTIFFQSGYNVWNFIISKYSGSMNSLQITSTLTPTTLSKFELWVSSSCIFFIAATLAWLDWKFRNHWLLTRLVCTHFNQDNKLKPSLNIFKRLVDLARKLVLKPFRSAEGYWALGIRLISDTHEEHMANHKVPHHACMAIKYNCCWWCGLIKPDKLHTHFVYARIGLVQRVCPSDCCIGESTWFHLIC